MLRAYSTLEHIKILKKAMWYKMQVKKRCGKMGCNTLIHTYETHCEDHKGYTNKQYNDFRNTYDKEYISFYKSTAWTKLRKVALRRDEWICQDCNAEGVITVAEEVHHIIETKDDWSKRLDLNNLISLCRLHHDKRHNR